MAEFGSRPSKTAPAILKSFFEASPVPFAISLREGGQILYANDAYLKLIGIARGEETRSSTLGFYADAKDRERLVRKMAAAGRLRDEVIRGRRADGQLFWCLVSASRLALDGRDVFFSVCSDVTEKIVADNILRLREYQLSAQNRALVELTSSEILYEGDLSASLRRITELTSRTLEVERASIWKNRPEEGRLECVDLFTRSRAGHESGKVLRAELYPAYFEALRNSRIINADDARSDPRTIEFTEDYLDPLKITSLLDAPVRVESDIDYVLCCEHVGPPRVWSSEEQNFAASMTDMISLALQASERRRAEQALAAERDLLENIMHSSVAGILLMSADGHIKFANSQAKKMLELAHDESSNASYQAPAWKLRRRGETEVTDELPHRRVFEAATRVLDEQYTATWPDGRVLELDISGAPLRDAEGVVDSAVLLLRDVTAQLRAERERAELTERLRRAKKMEAVGQLAGGIAHDYNNLLMVILGHIDLAEEHDITAIQEHLRAVRDAAERAAGLTRRLLAVSGQQVMVPSELDLNLHLQERLARVRELVGEGVEISLHTDPATPPIHGDAVQLDQILFNLCSNAAEAMNGRGQLELRTAAVRVEGSEADIEHPTLTEGLYAQLTVRDDGRGMEPEEVERCFDPFYSHNVDESSAGMGLSIVHGAVTQHAGTIDVTSTLGEGTAFRVHLPAYQPPLLQPGSAEDDVIPSHLKSILVAEDEEHVRRLTMRALEQAGYRVLGAENGERAISMYDAHQDEIALLVLDVVMPRVGGRKVWEHVRRCQGKARTLFISGYTKNALSSEVLADPSVRFLQKPFSATELLAAVAEVFPRKDVSPN